MLKQINTRKSIELDPFKLLKDDISNYRKLNEYQLSYIEFLTPEQKVEIIHLYEKVVESLLDVMRSKI